MDETYETLSEARNSMDRVYAYAKALLDSGAPVERVHRDYITAAFDLLDEAEAQALLAAAGDRAANQALKQIVEQLTNLREAARSELGCYPHSTED